jgi:hypothetical protein
MEPGASQLWARGFFTTQSADSAFFHLLNPFCRNLPPTDSKPFNRGYPAAVLRRIPREIPALIPKSNPNKANPLKINKVKHTQTHQNKAKQSKTR